MLKRHRRKIFLLVLSGIIALLLAMTIITFLFIDPWVGGKIRTALNNPESKYQIEIDKIHFSLLTSALELKTITVRTKTADTITDNLYGTILSCTARGIDLWTLLRSQDIEIKRITLSGANFHAILPISEDTIIPHIFSQNIRIDNIHIERFDLNIRNKVTAQLITINSGYIHMREIGIMKEDTLSINLIKHADLGAQACTIVTADSMYTMSLKHVEYAEATNTLSADSFFVDPNYSISEFIARHPYQVSCIRATCSNLIVRDFSPVNVIQSGNLISPYISIDSMDMNIFKDKRKPLHHINKPMIRELLALYPGKISIDSVSILTGRIKFTMHALEANDPGSVRFENLHADMYNLTNDTILTTEDDTFLFIGNTKLMGAGKLSMTLAADLTSKTNAFTCHGSLTAMNVEPLNPILEKVAYFYATSGRIDKLNFSFKADQTKATGNATMLYHGLDIAIKNKDTDDTTALRERIYSLVANVMVINANPLEGQEVRVGKIDFTRDPERFILHYCFNALLSGIKTTVINDANEKQKKRRNKK